MNKFNKIFPLLMASALLNFHKKSMAVPVDLVMTKSKIESQQTIGFIPGIGRIPLGGLSALFYDRASSRENKSKFKSRNIILWSLTDRGPNSPPFEVGSDHAIGRTLMLPNFSPSIIRIEYNLDSQRVFHTSLIKLKNPIGMPGTGRANRDQKVYPDLGQERLFDLNMKEIDGDPWGVDPESIARDRLGFFWLGEEYGPSLLKVAPDGRILGRYLPLNSPPSMFGTRVLPAVFSQREPNRGFEALAIRENTLYAFLQSAITSKDPVSRVRLLEFDLTSEKVVGSYFYPLSRPEAKLGDASVDESGNLYILEHYLNKKQNEAHRAVFKVDLSQATNLELGGDERSAIPAHTSLSWDLKGLGTDEFDKLEGLAILDENNFLIFQDNDFNVNRLLALKKNEKAPPKSPNFLFHIKPRKLGSKR